MSKILGHLEPQAVFHYFEEIAAIPHGLKTLNHLFYRIKRMNHILLSIIKT